MQGGLRPAVRACVSKGGFPMVFCVSVCVSPWMLAVCLVQGKQLFVGLFVWDLTDL